ncbi:MAG: glycerol-3-phosphate 1-O-acyltransferase PlsY [Oscillospiraceae bacterium]|nr:glycerol-3-phosphate 1-O-acyltransferase PlsY [Oscillospiraceae bacterium]
MYTTDFWISCLITALIAYVIGSLNFGIIVSRVYAKDDVRKHGSGNAGMTNMLRTYGKWPAIFTAAGDFLKAVAAIAIARLIFSHGGYSQSAAGYFAGLFVLLGHLYPVFFRFKGGKGVVTSLGVIMVVNPVVFIILCVIFIPIVFITKIVSLSSILGAIAYPLLTLAYYWVLNGRPAVFETACALITGAIVLFVHKSNIKRLLNGTENRFGQSKK